MQRVEKFSLFLKHQPIRVKSNIVILGPRFGLNYSMQHPFRAIIQKFKLIKLAKCLIISRARGDRSSLCLFHKIYCGAVSIEKEKYLTIAHC